MNPILHNFNFYTQYNLLTFSNRPYWLDASYSMLSVMEAYHGEEAVIESDGTLIIRDQLVVSLENGKVVVHDESILPAWREPNLETMPVLGMKDFCICGYEVDTMKCPNGTIVELRPWEGDTSSGDWSYYLISDRKKAKEFRETLNMKILLTHGKKVMDYRKAEHALFSPYFPVTPLGTHSLQDFVDTLISGGLDGLTRLALSITTEEESEDEFWYEN